MGAPRLASSRFLTCWRGASGPHRQQTESRSRPAARAALLTSLTCNAYVGGTCDRFRGLGLCKVGRRGVPRPRLQIRYVSKPSALSFIRGQVIGGAEICGLTIAELQNKSDLSSLFGTSHHRPELRRVFLRPNLRLNLIDISCSSQSSQVRCSIDRFGNRRSDDKGTDTDGDVEADHPK